jgi:hypothetical protein
VRASLKPTSPVRAHPLIFEDAVGGDSWNPDRNDRLTSSTATVETYPSAAQPFEIAENMVRRFRLIDDEFRRLACTNTVVIDATASISRACRLAGNHHRRLAADVQRRAYQR